MSKINAKGAMVWDGKAFQTIMNDFYVEEEEVERWIEYSENVRSHAESSIDGLKSMLAYQGCSLGSN